MFLRCSSSLLLILLFSLLTKDLFAQRQNDVWYFGSYAGVDFGQLPPKPLTDSKMQSDEACASVAGLDGKLLFYSDGLSVYNRNHTVMKNGIGLLGDKSTTQMAILQCPGKANLYMVFTIGAFGGGLYLSTIDMTGDGGDGEVLSKNHLLLDAATEKVTTVKHANGKDIWVIAHEISSNRFFAWAITNDELNFTPIISAVGGLHFGSVTSGIGALKASPDGKRLALAYNNRSSGFAELFKFDANSGSVSDPQTLTGFTAGTIPYGIEFSPDGNLLYLSEYHSNIPGNIYQVVVPYTSGLVGDKGVILGTVSAAGALQLAPDDKIYLSQKGKNYLHVINFPNRLGNLAELQLNALTLNGRHSQLGLPQIVLSTDETLSFANTTACAGTSTFFRLLSNKDTYQSIIWDFGDPQSGVNNTSTDRDPLHNFMSAGEFSVKLSVVSNGLQQFYSAKVKVLDAVNRVPTLTADRPVLCEDGTVTIVATGATGNEQYKWYGSDKTFIEENNGEFKTSVLNRATTFFTSITNGACEGELQKIDIQMNKADAAITASATTIDKGESVTLTANVQPGLSYEWKPSTYLNNTDNQQVISTPLQDITYTLTVTNATGCSKSATILIAVKSAVNIPNVFTPNADGTNDFWVIKNIDRYNNEVRVYSRSGALVYECRNYINNWKGDSNGEPLPTGVYYYLITIDKQKPLTGNLTILR